MQAYDSARLPLPEVAAFRAPRHPGQEVRQAAHRMHAAGRVSEQESQ
jgi:hypothetical protein